MLTVADELQASYSVTLTGGNITVSNNISYITPEELGIVNVPIGHVTGTRAISGSFTCYLTEDTGQLLMLLQISLTICVVLLQL